MDGAAVRRLARVVGEAAAGVREAAGALGAASGGAWTSTAAEEFRARLVTERVRVGEAADGLDEAVAALLRHAAAVDASRLDDVLPHVPASLLEHVRAVAG